MAEAPSERKGPRVSSPISRILSHGLLGTNPSGRLDSHLSMAARCRAAHAANPEARASNPRTPPYSALHRVGLAWPPCHHGAGALLPHHFTFAAGHAGVLCHFCCAFPGVSPAGRYPAPCSTVSGLSSKTRPKTHPRGYPGCARSITARRGPTAVTRLLSTPPGWERAWRSDRRPGDR